MANKPTHPVFAVLNASHALQEEGAEYRLSHVEFCVLLAIANRGKCFASYHLLAADMMLSYDSVKRAVRPLYEKQLIVFHGKHRNSNGKFTNELSVDVGLLEGITAGHKHRKDLESDGATRPITESDGAISECNRATCLADRATSLSDGAGSPTNRFYEPLIRSTHEAAHAEQHTFTCGGQKIQTTTPGIPRQSIPANDQAKPLQEIPPPAPGRCHRRSYGDRSCEFCGQLTYPGKSELCPKRHPENTINAGAMDQHEFRKSTNVCTKCGLNYWTWTDKDPARYKNYAVMPCEAEVNDVKDTDGLVEGDPVQMSCRWLP